jgi:hypothetical protein
VLILLDAGVSHSFCGCLYHSMLTQIVDVAAPLKMPQFVKVANDAYMLCDLEV